MRLAESLSFELLMQSDISLLTISRLSYHRLKANNINTIGNLTSLSSANLIRLTGIGKTTIARIVIALEKENLKLIRSEDRFWDDEINKIVKKLR